MTNSTTVVIPYYNAEPYFAEALASVRAQVSRPLEIVVVDDGSLRPLEVPRDWDGPPLIVIRTQNRGAAAARNTALAHARGEFVAFLDADDFWHQHKLACQEQALRKIPEAVGCYSRCMERTGFFGFGPYPPLDVSPDEFMLVLWYNNFFPPSATIVRREALMQAGGFREDLAPSEDIELWFRLLEQGSFVQVPESLTFYRRHSAQTSQSVQNKMAASKRARAAMIGRHADRLVHAGLRRDRLWDAYRNDILLVYYRRQFAIARHLLWDYWWEHPRDLAVLRYAMISLLPSKLVGLFRGQLDANAPQGLNDGTRGHGSAWEEALSRIRGVCSR